MVDLAFIGGFLLLLGVLAGAEGRHLARWLAEPQATSAELLARGENSPALFDFSDIQWDWFPERKAS